MGVIRSLYIGREAVTGTLAATMVNIPFISMNHTAGRKRIEVKEYRGVRVRNVKVQQGTADDKFKFTMYPYYDIVGWPLQSAINASTEAGHPSATGAIDHTFKEGTSVPSLSVQWYDGSEWHQMLGCYVDQWALTATDSALPVIEFDLVGQAETKISAPGAVPISLASYNMPADIPQQTVAVSGSGYALCTNFKLTAKNNRKALHTINASVNPSTFTEGEVEYDFDLKIRYTTDTASTFVPNYRTNTAITSLAYILTGTDLIGTGTPTPVLFSVTLNNPLIENADVDPMKDEAEATIKGKGGYSSGGGAGLTALLTNVIATYPGS